MKLNVGATLPHHAGGVVYQNLLSGARGAFARAKVSPVDPRRPLQLLARTFFGDLSRFAAYRLSSAQRAGWEALALLWPPSRGCPVALFNQVSAARDGFGEGIEGDPPPNVLTPDLSPVNVVISKGSEVAFIDYLPSPPDDTDKVEAYLYILPKSGTRWSSGRVIGDAIPMYLTRQEDNRFYFSGFIRELVGWENVDIGQGFGVVIRGVGKESRLPIEVFRQRITVIP